MPAGNEFADLLAACRAGDQAALDQLVRQYLPHIRAAVRSRLSARLRARFDTHDFAQEVWVSFLQAALDRAHLPDEAALTAYLAQMARNKVGEEYRYQTTQKVGLDRDTPLDAVTEPPARTHTPSAEAAARERWDLLTDGLGERDKRMLAMLRDGFTHSAIAREFGLSDKTVQRLLARLNSRTAPHG